MGMTVEMLPAKGPHFPDPLQTPEDIGKLPVVVDTEKELKYVYDAIALTRSKLQGEVPLIGFCGAPWTLFAYMIEGGGSKTLQLAKTWIFKWPEESKALLKRIADVCADFLVGQIRAGAQVSSQLKIVSNTKNFAARSSVRFMGWRACPARLPHILTSLRRANCLDGEVQTSGRGSTSCAHDAVSQGCNVGYSRVCRESGI